MRRLPTLIQYGACVSLRQRPDDSGCLIQHRMQSASSWCIFRLGLGDSELDIRRQRRQLLSCLVSDSFQGQTSVACLSDLWTGVNAWVFVVGRYDRGKGTTPPRNNGAEAKSNALMVHLE